MLIRREAKRPAESGALLVELLAGLAIAVTVIGVTTSLITAAMGLNLNVRRQTDQFESLRLAASLIEEDARIAYGGKIECGETQLVLYTSPTWTSGVAYILDGSQSPYDLYRVEWDGGNPLSSGGKNRALLAQGIDQPTSSGANAFSCDTSTHPRGLNEILLEKPLLQGQSTNFAIHIQAYPRNK